MTKETQLLKFIKETVGDRIFTAEFIKKDGSVRRMSCRLGVRKGVTGVGMAFDPISKGLLPVYDMQKQAFRMINLSTLLTLTANGETFINQ